ncbi:MAG: hypothetical protein V1809_04515 [Planctomycetota bacterium]
MTRFLMGLCVGILLFVGTATMAAEPPGFAQPPSAKAAGDKITISFSVKAPCDAAVWVEDGAGKVVRHIAAGLLGDKAPAPFQKGLSQAIEWDGKDDAGKKLSTAGLKVKVGLGLSAKFDRLLGYDPGTVGEVAGTATDEKGNTYVITHDDYDDRSSPQVMVFDPAGKYLRTLLPWAANVPPEQVKDYWVEIAPGRRIPKVYHLFQALYPLGPKQGGQSWESVVKISGEPLTLTPGGKVAPSAGKGLFRPMHLVASRTREEIFVRQWEGARWTRFDGRTGEMTALPMKNVADLAAAPDGTLYGHQSDNKLVHLDRDGKELGVLDDKIIGTLRGGNLRGVRGLGVSPAGDIYIMHYSGVQGGSGHGLPGKAGDPWGNVLLDVYSPDGKVKAAGVLKLTAGSGGVRADRAGNILVAEDVMPPDQPVPPEFKEIQGKARNIYRYIYGSILKFGPKGGQVTVYPRGTKAPDEGERGVNVHWSGEQPVRITGELRGFYPAIAPTGSGWGDCTCYVPRFDLDGFDRIFAPEVPRFSVKVLDSAGNELARIGSYGNADSAGPGSKIPEPEIAFAWPAYVAVTDEAVYVSDMVNRRVLRAKLVYAATAECPAP